MFPTLGLFAAVRCPELSASNPGGPCKRNPCIFSHTAPPPRATAITSTSASGSTSTSNKRSNGAVIHGSNGSNGAAQDGSDIRPKKVQKQSSSSDIAAKRTSSLFTQDEDDGDAKAAKTVTRTQQPANIAAGTSRIGAPRAMGGSRTAAMVITGSGKVIRRGPAPALQPQASPSTTYHHTSAPTTKGKERATSSDQRGGSSRPAPVSAFTSSAGPPRLPLNTPASYFPVATRNAMIKNMYPEFIRLYENFAPKQRHDLATEHALSQEAIIYSKNNKVRRSTT